MRRRGIDYGANAEAISNSVTRMSANSKGLPLGVRQVGGARRDRIQSSDVRTAYPRTRMRWVAGNDSERV